MLQLGPLLPPLENVAERVPAEAVQRFSGLEVKHEQCEIHLDISSEKSANTADESVTVSV